MKTKTKTGIKGSGEPGSKGSGASGSTGRMSFLPMPHGNTGKKKAGTSTRRPALQKIAVGPRRPMRPITPTITPTIVPDAKASLDAMKNGAAVHEAAIGERIAQEAKAASGFKFETLMLETDVPCAAIPGHLIKVAKSPHTPVCCVPKGGGTSGVEKQLAYGHLFAVAPDLFAVCEAILERSGGKLFSTDQVTGETFDELLRSTLVKVRAWGSTKKAGGTPAPQEPDRTPVAVEGASSPVVKGRYFCDWIPVRGETSGHFRIADAEDNMIAGCYVEANARLVTAALNAYVVAPVCPSLADVHAAEREQAAALQGKKVVWG